MMITDGIEIMNSYLSYIKSDFLQIILFNLLSASVFLVNIFFCKKDKFGMQAFRAFDLSDKTVSYAHKSSVVSGDLNILISSATLITLSIIGNSSKSLWKHYAEVKDGSLNEIKIVQSSKLYSPIDNSEDHQKVRLYSITWGIWYGIMSIMITFLFTNFAKTALGVLKPHFLQECMPNQDMIAKLDGVSWIDETLTRDICTNPDTDYRRSFPSGHVSQATVSVVYGFLEVNDCPVPVIALFLQIVSVGYTAYICSERIVNHHHHWSDVIGGLILGIAVAVHLYHLKEKQVRRQYVVVQRKISNSTGNHGTKTGNRGNNVHGNEEINMVRMVRRSVTEETHVFHENSDDDTVSGAV